MLESIFKLLVEDGGWEAVAVILALYIVFRVIIVLSRMASTLSDAINVNQKIASALDSLEKRQSKAEEAQKQETDLLSSAIVSMREVSKLHGEELSKVPERVRLEMTPLLEEIPDKVSRAVKEELSPEFTSLRASLIDGINTSFADFSKQINEKMESSSSDIPAKTAEKFEEKLKGFEQSLLEKIAVIISQLQESKATSIEAIGEKKNE